MFFLGLRKQVFNHIFSISYSPEPLFYRGEINEYTREIAQLSKLMAGYEDEYLDILPLRQKSPLIATIEDYFYTHGMRQKDGAKLLGVNESQFSQIMSGRRPITMKLAKLLHTKMAIDPKLILNYA